MPASLLDGKQLAQTMQAEPPPPVAAAPHAGMDDNQELPPNHPPIDNGSPDDTVRAEAPSSPITWKVPSRWKEMPNTSSMRMATYRVPRAAGWESPAPSPTRPARERGGDA